MRRVIVTFLEEGGSETVVIHPVDTMRRKRELAGKKWVDGEVELEYECYLALRRTGRTELADFESWLATVAELEPRLTHRDVDDALAAGAIDEAGAEALHRRVNELGDGEADPQTPPSL